MSLFIFDAINYTIEEVAQVIAEQIQEPYWLTDNLRTAVMYCPLRMTAKEFVEAAALAKVHPSTARIQFNRVRKEQRELGEIE